jgi:hypothetical protein
MDKGIKTTRGQRTDSDRSTTGTNTLRESASPGLIGDGKSHHKRIISIVTQDIQEITSPRPKTVTKKQSQIDDPIQLL